LLSLTVITIAPILYVTVWLRNQAPAARTPIAPAAAVLTFGVVAALLCALA
jgi:hypothetical protein